MENRKAQRLLRSKARPFSTVSDGIAILQFYGYKSYITRIFKIDIYNYVYSIGTFEKPNSLQILIRDICTFYMDDLLLINCYHSFGECSGNPALRKASSIFSKSAFCSCGTNIATNSIEILGFILRSFLTASWAFSFWSSKL